STSSILFAVNTVNLVNTVNAVKELPPPGGLALRRFKTLWKKAFENSASRCEARKSIAEIGK
ncbi:MAG: hypothetical protein ACKO9Q_26105, partial [Pirellula sp.]